MEAFIVSSVSARRANARINLWTVMVSPRAITLMGGHSLRENRMGKARC
jgi:hypothetical protein